ncbi:MAG TPA: sodium:solute symporter family protein [Blastocatellia bacterium]|nr:sodium:solute symporter family protein [Blastocatellia bacterium]
MPLLIILIIYAALMIGYGVFVSRRVQQANDFFVAGRGLGPGLIFSTMLAANIGAGSTVGATGLGYRDGLSAWWWVGSAGIGSVVLAAWVGPKIWRVARDNNLFTVGDYLEHRYNRSVRGIVAVLLCIGSLNILAGQLIAVAWILNAVVGVGKPVGCLIAGAVITAYFTLGGLHSSARVNVVQLAVKLTGFALVLGYLLAQSHGLGEVRSAAAAAVGQDNAAAYLGFAGKGWSAVARYLVILAPSFVISPGLLQKAFGARSARAVRVGVGVNAAGLLAYAVVPVLIGIIARGRFPGLPNHELALPTLMTLALPLWLGALMLGAIFSAELSAADAGLFMLSTSLSKDLYRSFVRPQASDLDLMRVARLSAIVCGVIGAGLAIVIPTVISALTIFYSLITAALVLPLIAGLYTTSVGSRQAIGSMLASIGVTFALEASTGGQGVFRIPSTLLGVASGFVVMALSSKQRQRKAAEAES